MGLKRFCSPHNCYAGVDLASVPGSLLRGESLGPRLGWILQTTTIDVQLYLTHNCYTGVDPANKHY